MKYYILAEDLAAAVVGPFANSCEAEAHMAFCRQRGDSAEMEVASETLADKWAINRSPLRMTAEEDCAFKYAGGCDEPPATECNEDSASCDCCFHENLKAAKATHSLIDRGAAQAELDALTVNAKRLLADALGNPIHAARLALVLARPADALVSVDQLITRIADIRLFTCK